MFKEYKFSIEQHLKYFITIPSFQNLAFTFLSNSLILNNCVMCKYNSTAIRLRDNVVPVV